MKYADMHCDTITKLYLDNGELFSNNGHNDILRMKEGECMLQNFAVFTDIGKYDSRFTYASIDYYRRQLEKNKDYIRPVYSYGDIGTNEQSGYISALLTLEDGSVVDGNMEHLKTFYDLGVRMIALTWNYENGIGFPNDVNEDIHKTNTKDGLTPFGKEYVKRMEELGIIVDVSHLSDKGIYDVLEITSRPFAASHSNARAVCPVARNLSDDMIRKMADRGCVTGLNFCAAFIEDGAQTTAIDGMVRHILYLVNQGGIDFAGLGSDFDGIGSTLEIKDASGMQLLYRALEKHFSEDEIEKIFYGNVLRLYRELL